MASLHQTMNDPSTLDGESEVPYSGPMSFKLLRIARLKQLAVQRGVEGPVALGALIGKKPNQVSDLLTGRASFGEKVARGIEEAAGLPPNWLDQDVEPIDLDAHPDLSSIRKVRLRLQAGVQGFAIEPEDGDGVPIFFRNDWLQQRGYKAHALVAVKVRGASMETNLYDGDTVVLNTADTEPKDGEVFAVNYEGEPVIKRMVRDGGRWWLTSDNNDQSRFPRKECTSDSCIIVGRVIHKQSERI